MTTPEVRVLLFRHIRPGGLLRQAHPFLLWSGMPVVGTKRICQLIRRMSAIGDKADMTAA